MDYQNKIAYIFGGSEGIGREVARAFATRGAHVIVFSRSISKLEQAVDYVAQSQRETGQTIASKSVDVTNAQQVDRVIVEAVSSFGPPDFLINCVGRAYPHYFEDITHEMFDETMKVNLYGIWNTISAALPHMKERGGVIVNTSSMVGVMGIFGYADYAASKFAIVGLSETLRSELERYGIRVLVLCPPDVDTPGYHVENQTKPKETRALSDSAKTMPAEDVAVALFRGIERNRALIIPGFDGRLIYFIKRLFPSLVESVTRWIVKRSRRSQTS